jgi:hypothetical protein
MNSLNRIMKATISIPDYSSISKRSISIPMHVLSQAMEPGSLVIVDFTGLKVYGKDEWHQEKHDVPARRTWRKLHLAIDEHHKFLPASSPRRTSVIPRPWRIFSPILSLRLRP